jgi:parallel beta-helix repeat protein
MGNSSTISSNTCTNNGASGINAQGGVVSGNTCSYNDADGIYANTGLVSGNFCSTNTGNGISVWSYCRVIENTCYNNGYGTATASGIRSSAGHNSIENNVATSNDYGIYCTTDDFFVGNRAHNNTISDFSYPSNCLRGQVIDGTAGGQISTTDPFTNFRF